MFCSNVFIEPYLFLSVVDKKKVSLLKGNWEFIINHTLNNLISLKFKLNRQI